MHSLTPPTKSDSQPYSWVIVFAGVFGLLASLGIGRFSLGMMLPSMGEGLGLSYSEMGTISTINFCGYLAAILTCGKLGRIFGARILISSALLLVGISMILIGKSSNLVIITLLYCCTGIGSALSNIPIMALISIWFEPAKRGIAAGICVMGNGLGILLSGKLVPFLYNTGQTWRVSWLVLGGLVLIIALICLLLIRNEPRSYEENINQKTAATPEKSLTISDGNNKKLILHCAAIYFLFGFTYVIYITFLVTSLVMERGMTQHAAGNLWSYVGLISLGSGPLFGHFSDKAGRKAGLMLVFTIQTVAYVLVAAQLPMISVYCSIILYGLVAFSIPTIIAALVGDYTEPHNVAAVFGYVTFAFGIGQIAGPAIAGFLAEYSASFSISFLMAGVLTFIAIIVSSRLPSPKER